MIKATELKIGNLLYELSGADNICDILQVKAEDILWIHNENTGAYPDTEYYRPIQLSEEILIMCGLKASSTKGIASFSEEVEEGDTYWWEEKVKRSDITDGFNFCIARWGEEGEFTFSYQDLRVRIKYLHHLQNLYNSLTGTDLIIQSLEGWRKKVKEENENVA